MLYLIHHSVIFCYCLPVVITMFIYFEVSRISFFNISIDYYDYPDDKMTEKL